MIYIQKTNISISKRPPGNPFDFDKETAVKELLKCADEDGGLFYWVNNYVKIYDNALRKWVPFELWPAQVDALEVMRANRFVTCLKSRQVGLSWLALAFIEWNALFKPEVLGLLFSKREDEAIELLHYRAKGMYRELPYWMKAREIMQDSKAEFALSNGSRLKASSTGGTDSYAATHVMVDEADLVYTSGRSLGDLLTAIEPAVSSAGGCVILISRSDKGRPQSTFKNLFKGTDAYLGVGNGRGKYRGIFIPWYARPGRTDEWYQEESQTSLIKSGSLDSVYEQYPATADEALSPPSGDKRFPFEWAKRCYQPLKPINITAFTEENKKIPGLIPHDVLTIYHRPKIGKHYVITVDGAEGNPGSDDSAATAWETVTGEEVALIRGKIELDSLASYVAALSGYYNGAKVFPERNSVGLTLLSWWSQNADITIVEGIDSSATNKKYGWLQNARTKPLMWSNTADMLRDSEIIVHTESTFFQIVDISGTTLRASPGNHDDLAVTVGLYCAYVKNVNKSFIIDFI